MTAEYLKDFIQTIAFLTPICILIWKGATLASKVEQIEKDVRDKTDKFCKDHKSIQVELEQEHEKRLSDTQTLIQALNEIQKSIVRIETKLDIEEEKK